MRCFFVFGLAFADVAERFIFGCAEELVGFELVPANPKCCRLLLRENVAREVIERLADLMATNPIKIGRKDLSREEPRTQCAIL